MSRRGAVRVNPVTGKMERVDAAAGAPPPGYHRDGSLLVPDALINGAKALGLGGAAGAWQRGAGIARA